MTKQEVISFIDEAYSQWKPLTDDDLNIAECIENDVFAIIMRFAYVNNLEIPGYDLNEIYAFIDRDEDADDYDPDDDDYNIREIYFEIANKMYLGEIVVPAEFSDVHNYFEQLFWPEFNEED